MARDWAMLYCPNGRKPPKISSKKNRKALESDYVSAHLHEWYAMRCKTSALRGWLVVVFVVAADGNLCICVRLYVSFKTCTAPYIDRTTNSGLTSFLDINSADKQQCARATVRNCVVCLVGYSACLVNR